jgi:hypothetical protein
MTNRNNVIFHLILAGMVASLVSILVDKHSLYDHLKVQFMVDLRNEEGGELEITTVPPPVAEADIDSEPS